MELLAEWPIRHGDATRRIELLHGDLAALPSEHQVDLLVISAFPNDYIPTDTSLIGALHRRGVSVGLLANDKKVDLREQYSCWLSKKIHGSYNFGHILCIESGWRGPIPQIVDDLFRAISPYLLADFPNGSVAMPLIGAGDQNWPASEMLRTILSNAVNWLQRGLPLQVLKIVIYQEHLVRSMKEVFASCLTEYRSYADQDQEASSRSGRARYDIFLSYSHRDSELADYIANTLKNVSEQNFKVFQDKTGIREGTTWLMGIADALDQSNRVVALYSPGYWTSRNCQMEFLAAFTRQTDSGQEVLFPIYLSDCSIPYMFRTLQYADCRVNDRSKLDVVCSRLAAAALPRPSKAS